MLTYITEVGSIYLGQNDLRTVHDQREFSKSFMGILLVESLEVKSKQRGETSCTDTKMGEINQKT